MKVSAKTDYACIALLELSASFPRDEPVRIRQIANDHKIPQGFLVQILLQLKGAGLVASTRGASGGYQLTRPPEEITLREVIEVIEGPLDSAPPTPFPSKAAEVLSSVWSDITSCELTMLSEITFADLVERTQDAPEGMYYI